MKDKLLITSKLKKAHLEMDKLLINYPHKYLELKVRLSNYFLDLIELIYEVNESHNKLNYKGKIISKLKMIDYSLYLSNKYKIISEKKFKQIGTMLLEINLMIYGWLDSEKNK